MEKKDPVAEYQQAAAVTALEKAKARIAAQIKTLTGQEKTRTKVLSEMKVEPESVPTFMVIDEMPWKN